MVRVWKLKKNIRLRLHYKYDQHVQHTRAHHNPRLWLSRLLADSPHPLQCQLVDSLNLPSTMSSLTIWLVDILSFHTCIWTILTWSAYPSSSSSPNVPNLPGVLCVRVLLRTWSTYSLRCSLFMLHAMCTMHVCIQTTLCATIWC